MSIYENQLLHRIFRILRKVLLNRYSLAFLYLRGEGIEIGALHNPLKLAPGARVRYVDRMSVSDLRRQYPELNGKKFVSVDIVADGDLLESIDDESQDFVIANHFVEHCQNPLLAIENMLRALRPLGILYFALPDMRYTFDSDRPDTTLAHLIRDYEEGANWSRRGHFVEWVRYVNGGDDPLVMGRQDEELLTKQYSIHYHAWTQREMTEMLLHLRGQFPFDIEVMIKYKNEVIFIVRKGTS